MAADRNVQHPKEFDRTVCEHPLVPLLVGIVPILDPLAGTLGMSPFCPVPCHAPDRVVDVVEDVLAHDMAVVVAPAADDRIEAANQDTLR